MSKPTKGKFRTRDAFIEKVFNYYDKGMQQRHIAQITGVHESTISRMIHGRHEKSRMKRVGCTSHKDCLYGYK